MGTKVLPMNANASAAGGGSKLIANAPLRLLTQGGSGEVSLQDDACALFIKNLNERATAPLKIEYIEQHRDFGINE